ncbi:hypothetical protein BJ912DRAFT_1049002 [Pholiota molesta]|nr:hypothetical protein BJ912DRAFT_1049002 [Pholiota molesta]
MYYPTSPHAASLVVKRHVARCKFEPFAFKRVLDLACKCSIAALVSVGFLPSTRTCFDPWHDTDTPSFLAGQQNTNPNPSCIPTNHHQPPSPRPGGSTHRWIPSQRLDTLDGGLAPHQQASMHRHEAPRPAPRPAHCEPGPCTLSRHRDEAACSNEALRTGPVHPTPTQRRDEATTVQRRDEATMQRDHDATSKHVTVLARVGRGWRPDLLVGRRRCGGADAVVAPPVF